MSGRSRSRGALAAHRAVISAFLDRAEEIAGESKPRIYVTAQFDLRRKVIDNNIAWLASELAESLPLTRSRGKRRRRAAAADLDDDIAALYDRAEIVIARDLYSNIAEWERRWSGERTLYSGAILMTAGVPPDLPAEPDWDCVPFRGGHDIPLAVAIEIDAFAAMCRPVLCMRRRHGGLSDGAENRPPRRAAASANPGDAGVEARMCARILDTHDCRPFRDRRNDGTRPLDGPARHQ
jgi:hypothetical protein